MEPGRPKHEGGVDPPPPIVSAAALRKLGRRSLADDLPFASAPRAQLLSSTRTDLQSPPLLTSSRRTETPASVSSAFMCRCFSHAQTPSTFQEPETRTSFVTTFSNPGAGAGTLEVLESSWRQRANPRAARPCKERLRLKSWGSGPGAKRRPGWQEDSGEPPAACGAPGCTKLTPSTFKRLCTSTRPKKPEEAGASRSAGRPARMAIFTKLRALSASDLLPALRLVLRLPFSPKFPAGSTTATDLAFALQSRWEIHPPTAGEKRSYSQECFLSMIGEALAPSSEQALAISDEPSRRRRTSKSNAPGFESWSSPKGSSRPVAPLAVGRKPNRCSELPRLGAGAEGSVGGRRVRTENCGRKLGGYIG